MSLMLHLKQNKWFNRCLCLPITLAGHFVFSPISGVSQANELPAYISYEHVSKALSADSLPFYEAVKNKDIHIFMYSPRETDKQEPHNRDEIYVVIRGNGQFILGNITENFKADIIMVRAYEEHRFINYSKDLTVWVVFFGPVRKKEP